MKYIVSMLMLVLASSIYAQENVYGHQQFDFTVEIVDRETNATIDGMNVYLFEMPSGNLVQQSVTSNGQVNFSIRPEQNYEVRTCKSHYLDAGMSIYHQYNNRQKKLATCVSGAQFYGFDSSGEGAPSANLYAQIAVDEIIVGKTFRLDNIYFDLDKSFLRPASKRELDKVVDILNSYPTMTIEMSSHTDSRASHEYNESLSQRRAQSTYDYLISQGISADRMTYKGYGETRLVNKCADGVKCSEAQHQLNRRTEFTVTSFEGKICETPTVEPKSFNCCE